MNLLEAKNEVKECFSCKDIENIEQILPFNNLGKRIIKILNYIDKLEKPNLKEIKEDVAKSKGYRDDILKTSWEYAILLTHRTKKQTKLYEDVINKLVSERY